MTDDATVAPPVPGPADQLRGVLACLVSRAQENSAAAAEALHEAVCAYVRQLKAMDLPPERVLVTIKAVANQAGVRDSRTEHVDGPQRPERLMETIVKSCIAEY